jgi:hypothetical protein
VVVLGARQVPFGLRAVTWWAVASLLAIATPLLAPQPGAAATGGRELELVTPPDPVAATVLGTVTVTPGGERIAYLSGGPMPGAPAGDVVANNIAARDPVGWTTTPIGLPYTSEAFEGGDFVALEALSDDLLTTVWTSSRPVLAASPPAGERGLYRRGPAGGVELLADLGPNPSGFVGASGSGDRVVFASSEHLLASDAGRSEGESIYESTGSQLRQVDVDGGGGLLSACGSSVADANGVANAAAHSVSRNGERIFFTNPAPSTGCSETSRVYLREGGTSTVEISASRCTRVDCNAEADVTFAGATPDGGSAFLATAQQLTDDDLDQRVDLYRYLTATGALALVSQGSPGAEGKVVTQPVLVSDSGERVYFQATGRLTLSEGSTSADNLYLADVAGLHFVAPGGGALQVSADGRVALLDSTAALLAGDTDARRDVYRYDASTLALTAISFGPGFGAGPFDATISSREKIVGEPQGRSLSADGARSLFATAEPLVAADVNGSGDVYEWDAGGPQLLSGASPPGGTELAGLSADGRTAVLRTTATLLPRDRDDGEFDLYAARVGGGFPEGVPPGCVVSCEKRAAAPVVRRAPATANPGKRKRSGRLRLLGDERRVGRELAQSGRAVLAVWAPAPGRISARVIGRIGGRSRLVAHGSAGAVRRGKVRIALLATPDARRRLARAGALPVVLEVRQAARRLARHLVLGGADR